jgi:ferritin-like metal-binding protein YciE
MKPAKNESTGNTNNSTGSSASNSSSNATNSENKNTVTAADNTEGKQPLLEKFFVDLLKDMYWAEQHLLKALPKMEQAATTDELKEAFEDHRYQTQKHVTRLEKVFGLIGQKLEGKKCEAMEGLVKEAESIIAETEEGTMTRDAALIIAAQKVEHYEIATYGGLVQLAITMGLHKAADILDQTLIEEFEADTLLTDIAESSINMEADQEGSYSWSKLSSRENEVEKNQTVVS